MISFYFYFGALTADSVSEDKGFMTTIKGLAKESRELGGFIAKAYS